MIKAVIFNPKIVELIDCQQKEKYDPDDASTLIYTCVFPYHHIPSTQTVADSYILFSTSYISQNKKNPLFMDVRVVIRVMAHQKRMRVKNMVGNRIDLISKELINVLDNSLDYGCGTLELISDIEDVLSPDYQFRDITFKAVDLPKSFCSF